MFNYKIVTFHQEPNTPKFSVLFLIPISDTAGFLKCLSDRLGICFCFKNARAKKPTGSGAQRGGAEGGLLGGEGVPRGAVRFC